MANRQSFDDDKGGPTGPAPFSRAVILPRRQARRLPQPANENRAPLRRRLRRAAVLGGFLALASYLTYAAVF